MEEIESLHHFAQDTHKHEDDKSTRDNIPRHSVQKHSCKDDDCHRRRSVASAFSLLLIAACQIEFHRQLARARRRRASVSWACTTFASLALHLCSLRSVWCERSVL